MQVDARASRSPLGLRRAPSPCLDARRQSLILPVVLCPHCGRDAPIVYRGPIPYCTACGNPRAPLSSPSVNLAGKPSQVGGAVARVVGWFVLVVGGALALGIGLFTGVVASTALAWALSLPIALVTLVTAIVLLQSGRSLSRSGAHAERATREQALLELAAHRGGVTASDAARALGLGVAEADEALTAFAKREPDRLTVDVDDQGVVWYRPARLGASSFGDAVRVAPAAQADTAAGEPEAEEVDAPGRTNRR